MVLSYPGESLPVDLTGVRDTPRAGKCQAGTVLFFNGALPA
jgi:hypothetical protein